MINVLFAAHEDRWPTYEPHLISAFAKAGLNVKLCRSLPPETVDYIIYAPNSPLQDFTPYINCKAVMSIWAGVEQITGNQTLTQPLTRMVDPGLTQGMVDWVTGHTLRYHLDIDHWIAHQSGDWSPKTPPISSDRNVCILGLGALGQACARTLAAIGFQVSGWSRRPKEIDGITCHSGDIGLKTALESAEILVLLLPDTPETQNIINARTLGWLPDRATLINPGRGPLIDDDALLEALNSGQLSHATLDVFRQEPLPKEHPFWGHPKVTVTPHIAAETRASTASLVIAENITRGEKGLPFLHLVNREAGY